MNLNGNIHESQELRQEYLESKAVGIDSIYDASA